jgi:hypothetical protein
MLDNYENETKRTIKGLFFWIIISLLFFLTIAMANAYSNSSGLVSRYAFEGNTNDFLSVNNGTIIGSLSNTSGYLGNGSAYLFNGDDNNYINIPDSNSLDFSTAISVCFWKKSQGNLSKVEQYVSKANTTGNNRGYFAQREATTSLYSFSISNNTGTTSLGTNSNTSIGNTNWVFLCSAWSNSLDSGKMFLFINGTETPSYTSVVNSVDTIHNSSSPLFIGRYATTGRFTNGTIDEVTLWNRRLSASEVSTMYNDYLSGIVPTDVAPATNDTTSPVVVLNSPLNVTLLTNYSVFNCSASDNVGLSNVSLFINGILNQTNTTPINNSPVVWNVSLGNANYTWFCRAFDNSSNSANSSTAWVYINYTTPITSNVSINWSFDEGSLDNYSCSDTKCNLTLKSDNGAIGTNQQYLWMYFDIFNVSGKSITYNITNINDSDNPIFWETATAYPVYACNKSNINNWTRITTKNWATPYYSFTLNTTCNNISIATYYPYSYQSHLNFLNTINSSGFVTQISLGNSVQGRPLDLIRITNPNISNASKQVIFIIAGQHASETYGLYSAEGIISFLINSTNSTAELIRNNSIFYVVPMINPDATYNGRSRGTITDYDMNREWDSTNVLEVNLTRNYINALNLSLGVDMFIDLHGDNGGGVNDYITNFSSSSLYSGYSANFSRMYSYLLADTNINSISASSTTGTSRWYNLLYILNYTKGISFSIEGRMAKNDWTPSTASLQGKAYTIAIKDYYNFTSPIPDSVSPVVVLNSPLNVTLLTNYSVFNCSASDNVGLSNVSLFINGVLNQTNTTPINNSPVVWNVSLGNANYTWFCRAFDNSSNSANSSTAWVNILAPVTYYVSNSGNDSLNGLSPSNAIKTISKLNTLTLLAGDSVLFNRGDIWHFGDDAFLNVTSGSITGNITYGSYGNGSKPILTGSYNLSSTSNWTGGIGNIWNATFTISTEIGSMNYNGNIEGMTNSVLSGLTSQGEFYYNPPTGRVAIYSVGNPATYYSSIEAGLDDNVIDINNKNYVVFKDLDIRYGARCGIEGATSSNIFIYNNSLSYIGGAYQSGTLRYGNAIQFWSNSHDIKVIGNNISYSYDAGITAQTDTCGKNMTNHEYSYNILTYNRYHIEFFNAITGCSGNYGIVENFSIHHNTMLYAGDDTFRTVNGQGIQLSRSTPNTTNFNITNNLIGYSDYQEIQLVGSGNHYNWMGNYPQFNYNLYYNTNSDYIMWENDLYSSILAFVAGQGMESNGLQSNPMLMSSYQPYNNSPACNMSSTGSYVGALACSATSLNLTPILQNISNINISHSNNLSIQVSCSDPINNSLFYYVNNSIVTINSTGFISDNPLQGEAGVYNILVTCSNGNLNSSKSFVYNITNTIPLTSPYVLPSTIYFNQSLTCYGNGTDADNDSLSYYYKWFENNVSYSNSSSITTGIKAKQYKCQVTPFDGLINGTAVNTSVVTVLNSIPVLSPISDYTLNDVNNLSFQTICSDADSDSLFYYVNNSIVSINSSGYVFDNPLPNETGIYSINVTCGDGTANVSDVFVYTITNLTNSAPAINLNSPSNASYSNVAVYVFNYSVFDVDNNSLSVKLFVNNSLYFTDLNVSNGSTINHSITFSVGANYSWFVSVNDSVAETNSSPRWFVYTRNYLSSPANESVSASSTVSLSYGCEGGLFTNYTLYGKQDDGDLTQIYSGFMQSFVWSPLASNHDFYWMMNCTDGNRTYSTDLYKFRVFVQATSGGSGGSSGGSIPIVSNASSVSNSCDLNVLSKNIIFTPDKLSDSFVIENKADFKNHLTLKISPYKNYRTIDGVLTLSEKKFTLNANSEQRVNLSYAESLFGKDNTFMLINVSSDECNASSVVLEFKMGDKTFIPSTIEEVKESITQPLSPSYPAFSNFYILGITLIFFSGLLFYSAKDMIKENKVQIIWLSLLIIVFSTITTGLIIWLTRVFI